jgi:hypothetical protein
LDRKRGSISWAPRVPDLNTLDIFFRSFVKDIVYHAEVKKVNDFLDRIVRAAECVTSENLPVPARN